MEIEKKYLVGELPDDLEQYDKSEIEQAYISTSPVIRIRKAGGRCFLTVKGSGQLSREEFELAVTAEQYERLSAKIEEGTAVIEKTRYYIPLHNNLTAEFDVYHGFLNGLLTVEVEFDSVGEAQGFIPPEWFGKDVTDLAEYANVSLAVL